MNCLPRLLTKRFKWWHEETYKIIGDKKIIEHFLGFYLFIRPYKIRGRILIEKVKT